MNLSIPTNWQSDLISSVKNDAVTELYGKLANDFVGGGRPSYSLFHVSKEEAAFHIQDIHRQGLVFNYLLNATCLNNFEWTISGQRQIRKLIDWLVKIRVGTVTVSIPYLLELIKKQYPHLKVVISTSAGVNSLERAKYWQDLGADEITLDSVTVNRNFRLIKKIREYVNCKLRLIANVNCLYNCPFRSFHCANVSHASQSTNLIKGFFIDYSYLKCSYQRSADPTNLIRADWIRPEDICYYEDLGIDGIKLVDRNMPTKVISLIVNAYVNRSYNGNLMDLFPSPLKTLIMQDFGIFHKFRYFFHPFYVNIFRFLKGKQLFYDDIFYIDNKSLNGFIEYFLEHDCNEQSCEECGYCDDIAHKNIKINRDLQIITKNKYSTYIDSLLSSKMFEYKL